MVVWAVVSDETKWAVELFPSRELAEAFVAEVEADEPEMAATLRIEPIKFEQTLS